MEQDLANVKYVGPATIKRLAEHGIASAQALLADAQPNDDVAVADAEWLVEPETGEMLAEEIPADYHVVTPEPELSKKELKKAAKQAKKALKKELKKAEKQQKALHKAERKAAKKAKKAEKKAQKAQKKKD
jgi:hypothetical protein